MTEREATHVDRQPDSDVALPQPSESLASATVTPDTSIWARMAARSDRWVGGTLIDCDNDPFVETPEGGFRTPITGLTWKPNGESMYFTIEGEEFSCGADRRWLAVVGKSPYGDGFRLVGYGGHEFHMLRPATPVAKDGGVQGPAKDPHAPAAEN